MRISDWSSDVCSSDLLWPVEVDPSQLEVALLNIVLNARDAMPGGGRIIISVENETGRDGDRVRISVADTGSGIAPELLSNIFDPFFTTTGVGKGTGQIGRAHVRTTVNNAPLVCRLLLE